MTSDSPLPTIVPDASVGAKWYFDDEEYTAHARVLVRQVLAGQISLVVPDCFFYELLSVVRRGERRRPPRATPARSDEIIAELATLPLARVDSARLLPGALQASRTYDIAPYDALYLTAAERVGATFIAADRRLYQRIRQLTDERWLGEV